jgi:hypothetical protein
MDWISNHMGEIVLAAIGVVVTVYYGLRMIKLKGKSQVQKTGDNSVAIQSSRDTNINIKDG